MLILEIVRSFFVLTLLIFGSHVIGSVMLRKRSSVFSSHIVFFVVKQSLGLGIISYAVFIVGSFGFLEIFLKFLVGFCSVSLFGMIFKALKRRAEKRVLFNRGQELFNKPSIFMSLLVVILVFFVLLNIVSSFAPPFARDALKYHLLMPKHYLQTNMVQPIEGNIFSFFPALVEMLFTISLFFRAPFSANLIHFYFGALCLLALIGFVHKKRPLGVAFLTGLCFLSTPLIVNMSSWAYVDMGLMLFLFLSVMLFFEGFQSRNRTKMICSAVFMGFSFSVKYMAFYSLVALVISFLAAVKKEKRKSTYKDIFVFFFVVLGVSLPWYLRNIIAVNNPVFPFFTNVFTCPWWGGLRAQMLKDLLANYGFGISIVDLLLIPFRFIFFNALDGPFDGNIGVVFPLVIIMLFLRALLRLKKSADFFSIYITVFFFLWFFSSQQVRLLLPILPVSMFMFSGMLDKVSFEKGKFVFISTILLLLISINGFMNVQYLRSFDILRFITGNMPEKTFLLKHVSHYQSIKKANAVLGQGTFTYLIDMGNVGYYCDFPFFQESVFEDFEVLKNINDAASVQDIRQRYQAKGITHILIEEKRFENNLLVMGKPGKRSLWQRFKREDLKQIFKDNNVVLYQLKRY